MMGLGFPGGPTIDRLAREGNEKAFLFSQPKFRDGSKDYSFSGLKTAAAKLIKDEGESAYADIAASFQAAVVDTLLIKCRRALEYTGLDRIVVGGGVSANVRFREQLQAEPAEVFFPRPQL